MMAPSLIRYGAVLACQGMLVAGQIAFSPLTTTQQQLKLSSEQDVKNTAAKFAHSAMSYYKGNESGQTPGILPGPPPAGDYYWWEGGALWGTMVDYWHLTGDDSYNDEVSEAMLFQVGPQQDYMPPNVTASLGNDDQGFWGMTAMLAAENNFPNPPKDKPQWLALAQAVFNTMAAPDRHDDTCGGGLRWQIPFSNNGYDYKNSIANGIFFNLGARLARYTDNSTYSDWANKQWDWITKIGFMTNEYNIYDGAHVETKCTDINKAQFSYNNAVWLEGAAYMYNYTKGSQTWETRVAGLLKNTLSTFFKNGVAYELACEGASTCTTDMLSFKGYLHRWMSVTAVLAPFTADDIMPILRSSVQAAVNNQCPSNSDGSACGFSWVKPGYDGKTGAGQMMNYLAATSSLLIGSAKAPVTNSSGGTSTGDYSAGMGGDGNLGNTVSPITGGDRAGAGILTTVILLSAAGVFGWMSID